MIKINNFFYYFIFISIANFGLFLETKINLDCINENLEPCSSKVSQSKIDVD